MNSVVEIVTLPFTIAWTILSLPVCFFSEKIGLKMPAKIVQTAVDMRGKVVVVTGANCGVGFRTAAWISKMGATVIMGCRTAEKGLAAERTLTAELAAGEPGFPNSDAGRVVFMQLDLGDLVSIRLFAEKLLKEFPSIDVLINNAGINDGGKTKQGLDEVFGVNFIGHFHLTKLLLERLKLNPNGARIVNVSSVVHRFAPHNCDFEASARGGDSLHNYQNSKLAMILFTSDLRQRLAGTQVKAFAVNPGAVKSEIWRSWTGVSKKFLDAAMLLFFLNTDQGAAPSIHCASQSLSSLEKGFWYFTPYFVPKVLPLGFELIAPFAGSCPTLPALPPKHKQVALKLWELCENILTEKDI